MKKKSEKSQEESVSKSIARIREMASLEGGFKYSHKHNPTDWKVDVDMIVTELWEAHVSGAEKLPRGLTEDGLCRLFPPGKRMLANLDHVQIDRLNEIMISRFGNHYFDLNSDFSLWSYK